MSDPFETPSPFQPQPSSPPQSPPQQAQPYQQAPSYQQVPPAYRQQAPYRQQESQQSAAKPRLSDNAAGGLAYLVIPAIIFLIVPPYSRNRFVRFHSWQSIMLFIASIIVKVGLMTLGRIPGVGLWFIGPLVGLAFFVLWLMALIQAFTGKMFKLPIVGDPAEKQANS